MKKNISRIAALLAAAALVFGAAGCSSDDDDNNPPNSTTPVSVTGVSVDPSTVSLEAGKTATVTATVTPSNADNQEVAWSTDNDNVATVTQEGVIKGVAAGSTTVTVTTKDGSKKATVSVTVTPASTGGDTPSASVTTWDFKTSNTWNLQTSDSNALSAVSLAPTTGTAATMTITGKWKYAGTAGEGYIQSAASSGVTVDDLGSTWKTSSSSVKYLSVTLASAGKITVSGRGAGDADVKRYLGILDSTATTVYDKAGNIGKTTVELTANVEAGTYLIASNGSRIFSVTVE